MLSFDWSKVEGLRVSSVVAKGSTRSSAGSFVCDELAILLEDVVLHLTVNADTDEIEVALLKKKLLIANDFSDVDSILNLCGMQLGWSWIGKNFRGYEDFFMISLVGLTPNAAEPSIFFFASGSSILAYRTKKL